MDWRVASLATLVGSFILIIIAIVGPLTVENQINNKVEDEFLFVNSNQRGYERWVDNRHPNMQETYVKLYLFNVTNPTEAAAGTEPPHLVEVGPYVYRQWLVNIDPVFSYITPNGTLTNYTDGLLERVVSFSTWQYFTWADNHPDNRNRSESDIIISPWFSFWTIMASELPSQVKQQILLLARAAQVNAFISKPVKELVWGYNDVFLATLQARLGLPISSSWVSLLPNTTTPEHARELGRSTVSCGYPNSARFQHYLIWEDKSHLTMWPHAPVVSGSGGNFFGFYRRGKELTEPHLFMQLGRVLELEYLYSSTYKGVEVSRYRFAPKESQNATLNPTNALYNQLGHNGLFNCTSFVSAPIFYSWPHFYLGDPWLSSHFSNFLQPNRSNDESYFDIQPTIGATCRLSRKIQSNILFGNVVAENLGINLNQTFYFPLLWMDVTVALSDQQANDMKQALDFYDKAVLTEKVLLYGGAAGSFFLFCLFLLFVKKHRKVWEKNNSLEALIRETEEEEEGIYIGYMRDVVSQPSYSSTVHDNESISNE